MIYALLVMTSFNTQAPGAFWILHELYKHDTHKTKVYKYIIYKDATSLDPRSNYFFLTNTGLDKNDDRLTILY